MALLKVLICGGGIAGPSLAFWLSKLNYDITIAERFPGLRAGGQQIDLRGQGVQVMRKMGTEQVVRSKVVDEEGIQFVDTTGKRMAFVEATSLARESRLRPPNLKS
jgi:2-polyprenyl-6-methoxyphenol hydroxylase-like FAD-dependent oxidoreductase